MFVCLKGDDWGHVGLQALSFPAILKLIVKPLFVSREIPARRGGA